MEQEQILELQGKENVDLVNRMRAYKDPLLDDFEKELAKEAEDKSESDSDDESGSGESSEGEDEIEFPRDSAPDLMTFLQRDIANMSNVEDDQKRKFGLMRLYQVFVLAKKKAEPRVYSELLPEIQKALFKRLSDKLEKSRELACLIIKEFFRRCDDITLAIPFLVPVLVERLNADDLEGHDYVDEKLKPVPTQRAQEMKDPRE